MNVEYYTDLGETLPEPVIVGQAPYLADLAGKRVLVADDVADTGATLHFVRRLLPDDADVRVAVLYAKPHTTYAPELAWRETDRWIRFPWIQVPPIRIESAGRSSVLTSVTAHQRPVSRREPQAAIARGGRPASGGS